MIFAKRIQNVSLQCRKYAQLGSLTQCEYDLIRDPIGWFDCVVVHKTQVLVSRIDKNMKDFQRTTFGAVRQFDVHKAQVLVSRIDKNMKDFQRTAFGAVRQFDVHKAQVLVSRIDKNMKDFQRTTFGAVRQFDVH